MTGPREEGRGVFPYLRALLNNKGLTVVEILIVCFILVVLLAGLLFTLITGQNSFAVTQAKLELQSELRMVIDWIARDLRETIPFDVSGANDPSYIPTTGYLRFHLWEWQSGGWVISDDFIEYIYDANQETLTRRHTENGVVTSTHVFSNIIEPPFYTQSQYTGDSVNELNPDTLHSTGRLIIVISGERNVRGTLNIPLRLISEIRIRNG